jgi:3-methyladenine DNA glycosylase AlkC
VAERFSLKDHLFNAETVGLLATEYSAAIPEFDPERFQEEALSGFGGRELLARLDWLADCVEVQLADDFPTMAAQLEAAMPPPLDPAKRDDDFGRFIHAIPGILAVRHGLEDHRERAMALLHAATQRFSMEFYIRPFLNRWPEETLAALTLWSDDPNYHVRRLVSEGTRPKLPWAKAVTLRPEQTLPLLDRLHGDSTRYVTRSVANHLNDLSKSLPEAVLDQLGRWRDAGRQEATELDWITSHALRTLIKSGHSGALAMLGYSAEVPLRATVKLTRDTFSPGETIDFACEVAAETDLPVLVDYRIEFARPDGRAASKVFKLKRGRTGPDKPFAVMKSHLIKPDATTFTWHPGRHRLVLQVNGVDRAAAEFDLT